MASPGLWGLLTEDYRMNMALSGYKLSSKHARMDQLITCPGRGNKQQMWEIAAEGVCLE